MKTLKLAVFGKDVSKSVSPEIHSFIARKTGNSVIYDKVSVTESRFNENIDKYFDEYDGFNVTIPYKLTIIPHLNELVGDARIFGAVNTVSCRDKKGYNTDGMGFMLMLRNNGIEVSGKKVLLLGAGGAGRSVAKKLADAGADVFVYDRNNENSVALQNEFGVKSVGQITGENYGENYYMIVNATGVGMHDTEGASPLGKDVIALSNVCADLIYTPKKSRFLEIAESLGKKIINGEAMLFYQAYYAECIYFGKEADDKQAKILFEQFAKEYL